MRAARLLQILLILQNRGRQTSAQLGAELEVTPRTILRDVDAMTEAGLPIIVHQGNRGGIELGFNYRTRLTGLDTEEARALGLILAADHPMIEPLGLSQAARRARTKLLESFPDTTRALASDMSTRFSHKAPSPKDDPRVAALAQAIQDHAIVRLGFSSAAERNVHPVAMRLDERGWHIRDARLGTWIAQDEWGRVNISAHSFEPAQPARHK